MKILIISDAWKPQVNGVVRTYEYLKGTLEKSGHTVKVIGPRNFSERFAMPGYKEIDLVPLCKKHLTQMIRGYDADTVHIATEGPIGWAARRYCIKNKVKFTTSYHTQFPEYAAKRVGSHFPFLQTLTHQVCVGLIKSFHAPSAALLVTTKSMADELKNWGIKTPIQNFTRGIDTDLFHPGAPTLFEDLPRPIALYVGRLAIEKSVEDFLSMDWHGSKVVVGHGPDYDMLRKKYPNVIFAGKKTGTELANYYRSSDVFMFPSRTDTFGIVLIEALACGLPIAAHDVIGPRDVVTNASLGALNEDLSLAAQTAISNNGTSEDRYQHVIKNYSWEKAMKQFIKASNKTLKTPKTEKTLEKAG